MTTEAAPITAPDNLLEYSWSGTLPKRIYQHRRRGLLILIGSIFGVAIVVSSIVAALTGQIAHVGAAFPATIWITIMAVPVYYSNQVRKLWVLRPMKTGLWLLDETQVWKEDLDPLVAEDSAQYGPRGSRVHWTVATEGGLVPLDPWHAKVLKDEAANEFTAAHVAGLKSYLESVQDYSYKKTLGLSDVVKMGLLAAIVGGLLIGIFLLSGRLTREPVPAAPVTGAQQLEGDSASGSAAI